MQWRLLARRCPLRSFTIVGDMAQASSAAAAHSWADALRPIVGAKALGDRWRIEELTVNYRTPAQIAEAAERVAEKYGLPITRSTAVRASEWPVENITAHGAWELDSDTAAIEALGSIPQAVQETDNEAVPELDLWGEQPSPDGATTVASGVLDGVAAAVRRFAEIDPRGTIAVIVPERRLGTAFQALAAEFGAAVGRGADGLSRTVAVLSPHDAKGLEFDSVIIADPDAIRTETVRGASSLYVAMTRPTQRLAVVSPGTASSAA